MDKEHSDTRTNTPDLAHRWRTALHETGHAVANIEAMGAPRAFPVLLPGGGGICYCPTVACDGAFDFDMALVIACGTKAERLMDECEAPETQPDPVDFLRETPKDKNHMKELRSGLKADHAEAMPDASRLAAWCTAENPSDPEAWARRYYWIQREADRLIENNRERIVAVARELYVKGQVVLRREELYAPAEPTDAPS